MSYNCPCIRIDITDEFSDSFQYDVNPAGTYGGQQYFTFPFGIGDVYIYWNGGGDWVLSTTLGGSALATYNAFDCPLGVWTIISPKILALTLSECTSPFDNCCLSAIHVLSKLGTQELNFTFAGSTGIFNGAPYWTWFVTDGGINTYYFSLVYIPLDTGCQWHVYELENEGDDPDTGDLSAVLEDECGCPIGTFSIEPSKTIAFATASCRDKCVPLQDRTQRKYLSVRLPIPFQEENRGWRDCCDCPMTVLAGGDTDTWKNDVTSAWIKLSDPSDTATFTLLKDGQPVNYVCPVFAFPNEPNAFYTTIQWRDVLASDGVGCYKLFVGYNIAGIVATFQWGIYILRPYTIQNALKTARIRVKFNLQQEVEGINFTDANVEDCIRFYGFIGERQPNTEIDNLIYQDRKVKSVVRENLDTYLITSDPLQDCVIFKLTDLYLLSENEMFISDYNVHNHSYRIQDLPVILEESPEIDYLDIWQRRAKLTAKVGIKSKNRRTYYK